MREISTPDKVGANEITSVLTTLRIRNLALVTDLTLELSGGLVVITGETGAGKSILLGALNLVLGQRADRSLIRSGEESCTVEAALNVRGLPPEFHRELEALGLEPCADHQLLLKRTFTSAGANRQFVNGTPTTLGSLARVGDWLVDMHGPHEHQSLLHPARQLALLDAFGGLQDAVAEIAGLVARRRGLEERKAALVVDEQTYARQLDLLRHQAGEIEAARLAPDEEESLVAEHQRARNAARLLEVSQAAVQALDGDDASLLNQAGTLGRLLHELQRLDPGTAPMGETFEQSLAGLRDLQRELGHYADRIDLDPAHLQTLEERLNLLQALKRKYGGSLAEVIVFGREAREKLAQLEGRDAELAALNRELATIDAQLIRAAGALSVRRRAVIPKLSRAATIHLSALGFRQSEFSVGLQSALGNDGAVAAGGAIGSTGGDTVEFLFAPNPGEPAKPLRAIASSGELARVMLALKTVLAAQDEIPVLVFDEVDANVGGETAHAVGAKMREIARRRQVLCITHLPQVAAAADAHWMVTKDVHEGRTVTRVQPLERADRVTELARMLGGQTDAARRHALALLEERR